MEAISTLENIRPPVVSRWSQKVNNCLRLQCQNILLYIIIEYLLTIWNIANVHVVKHNSVYNYLVGETSKLQMCSMFLINPPTCTFTIFQLI